MSEAFDALKAALPGVPDYVLTSGLWAAGLVIMFVLRSGFRWFKGQPNKAQALIKGAFSAIREMLEKPESWTMKSGGEIHRSENGTTYTIRAPEGWFSTVDIRGKENNGNQVLLNAYLTRSQRKQLTSAYNKLVAAKKKEEAERDAQRIANMFGNVRV